MVFKGQYTPTKEAETQGELMVYRVPHPKQPLVIPKLSKTDY